MVQYFAQNTPQAGLERMMMTVPGFKPRGGGTMILNRFHYRPEDVDCRNCLHGNVQVCILSVCPYIAERLEAGCIGLQELIEESFRDIPHAGLKKRIEAVTSWKGTVPGRPSENRRPASGSLLPRLACCCVSSCIQRTPLETGRFCHHPRLHCLFQNPAERHQHE